jgi:hypothetical protein
MKQIQPINSWYNGQSVQGSIFSLLSNSDNLTNEATFSYQIFTNNNEHVAGGILIMTGFDYDAYSSSPDSNAYAYQWGATQLNLTLV